MKPYSPPLEDRAHYQGLRLDFNERTIPPSLKVLQALQDFSFEVYPEYGDLTARIARYAEVLPEEVMITNGSDQGMDLIFRTFTGQGDRVIIPTPSFAMYEQCAGIIGNRMSKPLYGEDLSFPAEEVLEVIDADTRLIVLCNPNNPTGTPIPGATIRAILEKAAQCSQAMVYVDEAYFEYSDQTVASWIKEYPHLIITRTFSKAFGIPSLRVGYVLSQAANINELLKVRGPYDVNTAGALAACAALEDLSSMQSYVDEVMDEAKPMVEAFFRKNGIWFAPSRANFLLFRPEDPESTFERLKANGFLLRPRSGPRIEETLRMNIGTTQQMQSFIQAYQHLFL